MPTASQSVVLAADAPAEGFPKFIANMPMKSIASCLYSRYWPAPNFSAQWHGWILLCKKSSFFMFRHFYLTVITSLIYNRGSAYHRDAKKLYSRARKWIFKFEYAELQKTGWEEGIRTECVKRHNSSCNVDKDIPPTTAPYASGDKLIMLKCLETKIMHFCYGRNTPDDTTEAPVTFDDMIEIYNQFSTYLRMNLFSSFSTKLWKTEPFQKQTISMWKEWQEQWKNSQPLLSSFESRPFVCGCHRNHWEIGPHERTHCSLTPSINSA